MPLINFQFSVQNKLVGGRCEIKRFVRLTGFLLPSVSDTLYCLLCHENCVFPCSPPLFKNIINFSAVPFRFQIHRLTFRRLLPIFLSSRPFYLPTRNPLSGGDTRLHSNAFPSNPLLSLPPSRTQFALLPVHALSCR